MMMRTIVKSSKNSLILELPDDLVGKTIEIIAFEIDQITSSKTIQDIERSKRIEAIDKALGKHRVDLSGYKFDSDDANSYE